MNADELEIEESQIDEFEEVQESLAEYDDLAAKLLDTIAQRDEMAKLLTIAAPSKIAEVRELVAEWNGLIAETEDLLESQKQLVEMKRDQARNYLKLDAMTKLVEPELLRYLAEHTPEKFEELEAILNDDGKSH